MEMENTAKHAPADLDPPLKLALAMAIVESRRRRKLPTASTTTAANHCDSDSHACSSSDAMKWKKKAIQRKEEILRLREDLKIAEEGVHHDVYPQNISCKCYFYDNLGQLSPMNESDPRRLNDVLRRRFLRQVRLSERRRRLDCSSTKNTYSNTKENEMEQLRASVDFLVDLCETYHHIGVEEGNFKNLSHQATDFILATLKALSLGRMMDMTIESIVSSLIVRLMKSMCNKIQGDESLPCQNNLQFSVQHLMRNLGTDPYIGQRVILSVCQRISLVAESLLFMDPFDSDFPKTHHWIKLEKYVRAIAWPSSYKANQMIKLAKDKVETIKMIQLIEFLISDYLLSWPTSQNFDTNLLEEWLVSVFQARKSLVLLENRNSLYMLYMDRVIGDLTRHLGQAPFLNKIRSDIVAELFG